MSVLTLRPNADSAVEFSPSVTTDHYTLLDEATLDEADYIYNAVTGFASTKTEILGFPNHSTESGTINSVTVKCKAKYILVGSSSVNATIAPCVTISSTVYTSATQNLTDSVAEYSYAWETNPATSSAWSWTEIDDLLGGIRGAQGFTGKNNCRKVYVYQLWVEVDYTAGGGGATLPLKNVFNRPFRGVFR